MQVDLVRFVPRSLPPDPDWLGVAEASLVLGVSRSRLRRWSGVGRFQATTDLIGAAERAMEVLLAATMAPRGRGVGPGLPRTACRARGASDGTTAFSWP